MTQPASPATATPPPIPLAPGVIAHVQSRVISVDNVADTAVIRVVDNNGAFLTVPVTLPQGVLTAVQFGVQIGDVLESADAKQQTAVVRWTDGLLWSYSPSGVPALETGGWRKIGAVALSFTARRSDGAEGDEVQDWATVEPETPEDLPRVD